MTHAPVPSAGRRKQIPISEASFMVDVKVEGVPNPWRCYHDGTNVTGTEYQGEG